MLTLEALEAALAPLGAISSGEATFDAGSTQITLRVLSTDEEIEVQKYASLPVNLAEDSDEGKAGTVAIEYIERFKIGILSYAIVQIGQTDLRGVKFIETPEKLDNGTTVKILKAKIVREFLSRLPGGSQIISRVYRKYYELLSRVETEAEKAVVFEPTDVDAEIERLETRLQALKNEKDRTSQPPSGGLTEQVKRVLALEESQTPPEKAPEATRNHQEVSTPPPAASVTPPRRQSIIPGQGVAPVTSSPPARAPIVRQSDAEEPEDSFMDTGDPEAMEAAMARETARVMARRAGVTSAVPEPESALASVHGPGRVGSPVDPTPGISQAKLMAIAAAQAAEEERATLVGRDVQGVETYRMPTQQLATVPVLNQDVKPAQFNRTGEGAGKNPRFRPAGH